MCAPGICKAYALYGEDETGVRVGYCWDNEVDEISSARYSNGEPNDAGLFGRYPALDDEHGRFVYRKENDIIVVDFCDRGPTVSTPHLY